MAQTAYSSGVRGLMRRFTTQVPRWQCDGSSMLHESMLTTLGTERRAAPRLEIEAEVAIVWLHDPQTTLRYTVLDMSEGGMRLRSSLPVVTGTTGTVLRALPTGNPINKSVMVSWVSEPDAHGHREVGLRYF